MSEPIPLRELIEGEIRLLRTEIEHERELREKAEEATRLALEKQAVEYERRLDALNHAHQQQINDKATFLSRETYDAFRKEFDTWKVELTRSLALSAGREAANNRMWNFVSTIASAVIAATLTALLLRTPG